MPPASPCRSGPVEQIEISGGAVPCFEIALGEPKPRRPWELKAALAGISRMISELTRYAPVLKTGRPPRPPFMAALATVRSI